MTNALTPKARAFITEFLVDLNQTQAAIRAGCAVKSAPYTARTWLKNPAVQAAIQQAMNERAARTAIQADVVLEAIVRNALKAEAKGDHAAATRGWELVGKHLKLFTEKHEHGGIGGGPVQFVISAQEALL
jgi:phage terminase small subunit